MEELPLFISECQKYHDMVHFASKRDQREGVCEHLCTGDPGHRCAIAAPTRKNPGACTDVAIGAYRPLEVGRRIFLAASDHEGIARKFVDIVKGIAGRAIETRRDVLAWLFSK